MIFSPNYISLWGDYMWNASQNMIHSNALITLRDFQNLIVSNYIFDILKVKTRCHKLILGTDK